MDPLAQMAAEECRYDSLPPHLMRRPATLADLDRKIAATEKQLQHIAERIELGVDLKYWDSCQDRARRQLEIYKDAQDKLVKDAISRGYREHAKWLEKV